MHLQARRIREKASQRGGGELAKRVSREKRRHSEGEDGRKYGL